MKQTFLLWKLSQRNAQDHRVALVLRFLRNVDEVEEKFALHKQQLESR